MMKKIFAAFMTCMLLFGLTACSSNETTNTEPVNPASGQTTAPSEEADAGNSAASDSEAASSETDSGQDGAEPEDTGKRALVVYFSATGNTKAVAEIFAAAQGADLYEIVPEQPYTDEDLNYNDSTTRATVEQNDENARPAISGGVENIADYDVIYVGFPIWWGDMPRILYTFFDSYDLSGKTIAPFATSGGSGISKAVQSIETLEPEATVTEGLLTSGSSAESDLTKWLGSIGVAE